jgi:hypothetical protein
MDDFHSEVESIGTHLRALICLSLHGSNAFKAGAAQGVESKDQGQESKGQAEGARLREEG